MNIITNESGTFTINRQGVLTDFRCARKNELRENVWWHLDIPEGVRVIPEDAFEGCEIINQLTFPQSLRVIGTGFAGTFTRCRLPHVELPETLEELGCYAFAGSTIRSLRIPRGLRSIYNRQFKASIIGTLYLPEEFRAEDTPRGFCEKHEWGREQYGYIRSILVNDVKIGEVLFE